MLSLIEQFDVYCACDTYLDTFHECYYFYSSISIPARLGKPSNIENTTTSQNIHFLDARTSNEAVVKICESDCVLSGMVNR